MLGIVQQSRALLGVAALLQAACPYSNTAQGTQLDSPAHHKHHAVVGELGDSGEGGGLHAAALRAQQGPGAKVVDGCKHLYTRRSHRLQQQCGNDLLFATLPLQEQEAPLCVSS